MTVVELILHRYLTIAQSNYACHLQRHADNKEKRACSKTAISYILDNFPNAKGIVMIDSLMVNTPTKT